MNIPNQRKDTDEQYINKMFDGAAIIADGMMRTHNRKIRQAGGLITAVLSQLLVVLWVLGLVQESFVVAIGLIWWFHIAHNIIGYFFHETHEKLKEDYKKAVSNKK